MIRNNTNTITDGLIFNYDANSIRSYKGPTITNIANQITPRGDGVNTYYKFYAGTDNEFIPGLGPTTYSYMDMYNDYGGGSGNCCPSPFTYGNGLSVSGNTVYTYGIVYRSANRYTNANLMYHYEFNGSGGYLTEFGVHNAGYSWQETHLGNGWYWSRAKFTSQPTAASINTGSWMYQYATWNRWEVAKILIAAGDWTNLHPSLWPDVGTTRSNTQALTDLTSRSSTTAGNLVYNADGTFNYSSSNPSYVQVPLSTSFNKLNGTINVWIYPTSYNGGNGIFVNRTDATANAADWLWIGPYSGTFYFRLGDGSTCCNNDNSFGSYYSLVPLNTWTNLCCTWSSGKTSVVYINGKSYQSRSISTIPSTSPDTYGRFGLGHSNADSYYNGKMPVAQIYNRQLSDSEVFQNFNAMRGRYGV